MAWEEGPREGEGARCEERKKEVESWISSRKDIKERERLKSSPEISAQKGSCSLEEETSSTAAISPVDLERRRLEEN